MSQCQMCGREIPDGQQLCSICRNAMEWRQRQQQIQDSVDRHPGGGQSAPVPEDTKHSKVKEAKRPGPSRPAKQGKVAPAAKVPQPGRLPAVILGAVLVAFLLFFAAALLFGGHAGGSGGSAITLEPWQGGDETVQTGDPGPEQVVAAAPENSLPQQAPADVPQTTEPQTSAEGQQTARTGEYIFPNSDSAYLTRDQVAALTPEQLRLARNEIYARHGRIFQDEGLAAYFSSKSWYQPLYDGASFDALGDSILNEYEIANRDLIQEYEALYSGQ